jgi:hypothetical protein
MTCPYNIWELALLVVVSAQVTAIAYLHAPRLKALALCIPLPFTLMSLAMGRPVDVTHLLGVIALSTYLLVVRVLHHWARVPIIPTIALSVVTYCAVGWVLLWVVPSTAIAFWILAAVLMGTGLLLHTRMESRTEPGHRTPLPIWLKLPIVMAVVCGLLFIKESMQGVAALFPMVSVVGAYENRHSLRTLTRHMPVFIITILAMMAVARLTQPHVGIGIGLALGWVAFVIVLTPLIRDLWSTEIGSGDAAVEEASPRA